MNYSNLRDQIIEKSAEICKRDITEIFQNWEQVGIQENHAKTYAEQILEHISGLTGDMVKESFQKKEELIHSVKLLGSTASKLSKELGQAFDADPYNDVSMSLMLVEKSLKEQVQKLQSIKEQRLKYIKELSIRESETCKKLGIQPAKFTCELPSEQEIKDFENYLNIQELEKSRLTDLFKEIRKSIISMMEELQINPTLEFERMVIHDQSNFIFSKNNMTKLKELKEKLRAQIEQAKAVAEEKKEQMMSLWDYLDEPMELREQFLNTYQGYNLYTINAMQTEIKRCREKRSENIGNYVKKIREEISNLWELCKYSDSDKKAFGAYYCETYTEDLLTLHEMEADTLRKYYNSNRKVFELLSEWEVQFEKLKDLDKRANDPDRYHNRGGQLLMEEKERKAAEKKLPKLETQLHMLVEEFEFSNNRPFLVNGLLLRDFMTHTREQYEVEKENMKLARKHAKDNKSAKKTPLSTSKRTPGATSMSRLTPGGSRLRLTPGGTSMMRATPSAKRKLPYDPSPNSAESKKRAMNHDKTRTKVIVNKVRRSIKGNKNMNGSSRSIKSHNSSKRKRRSKNETTLSVSSYGNFQEHLENRDELRSSILPEEVKKTVSKMLTPIKTPIKPVRRKVLAISTPNRPNTTRTLRGTPKGPIVASTPKLTHPIHNSSIEI